MAQYAVPADLYGIAFGCTQAALAQLADDTGIPPNYAAVNTQAVLNDACVQASNKVRTFVLGHLDLSDTQVLADLKRWTCALALYSLYLRRSHWGPANKYNDLYKDTMDELKAIQAGLQVTGSTEEPQNEAWASSGDDSPIYARSPAGGGGSDSKLLEGF